MEQAHLSDQFSDEDHWSLTFRSHVLGLEEFLAANLKPRWRDRIPGEQTVYLAGMIARELDRGYRAQIQEYLVEDPEEIDRVVRRHALCLGQNAPVVTLSRINAEHSTLQIAIENAGQASRVFLLRLPARYFGIASAYSLQAGKPDLARTFDFFRNHLAVIVDVLAGYLDSLEWIETSDTVDATQNAADFGAPGDSRRRACVPPRVAPEELEKSAAWRRFGSDTNDTNRRKDFWEAARLNPNRKNRLSGMEFRAMLDYTNPN